MKFSSNPSSASNTHTLTHLAGCVAICSRHHDFKLWLHCNQTTCIAPTSRCSARSFAIICEWTGMREWERRHTRLMVCTCIALVANQFFRSVSDCADFVFHLPRCFFLLRHIFCAIGRLCFSSTWITVAQASKLRRKILEAVGNEMHSAFKIHTRVHWDFSKTSFDGDCSYIDGTCMIVSACSNWVAEYLCLITIVVTGNTGRSIRPIYVAFSRENFYAVPLIIENNMVCVRLCVCVLRVCWLLLLNDRSAFSASNSACIRAVVAVILFIHSSRSGGLILYFQQTVVRVH